MYSFPDVVEVSGSKRVFDTKCLLRAVHLQTNAKYGASHVLDQKNHIGNS